jgi:hypothetical protein
MSINIEIEGLDQFQGDIQKADSNIPDEIGKAMVNSVNTIKNTAQDLVHYVTGTLRRSIFTDVQDNGFTGIVGVDPNIAPYGYGVEFGNPAHIILPVNKKALFWKGALNPYRLVHHPGNQPYPFMQPALENSVNAIQNFFETAVQNIIATMAGQ